MQKEVYLMPYLEKLKTIKEGKKLTNVEIAKLSDLPLATITRVFNGSTPNPTFETFVRIAIALGVSLDEIAGLKLPDIPEIPAPILAPVENTVNSYIDLLNEKDKRIEKENERVGVRGRIALEQRNKKNLLQGFAIIIILCIFAKWIDNKKYF